MVYNAINAQDVFLAGFADVKDISLITQKIEIYTSENKYSLDSEA